MLNFQTIKGVEVNIDYDGFSYEVEVYPLKNTLGAILVRVGAVPSMMYCQNGGWSGSNVQDGLAQLIGKQIEKLGGGMPTGETVGTVSEN